MDKGMPLRKELAMGSKEATKEATGNMFRDNKSGKFKCGGAVKTKKKSKK